jgi:predicted nucleic acid-binding protein
MRIFLDANVIISVLNKEYPLFSYSSRILSLADSPSKFKLYTSPICLAISFYFAEKKYKAEKAKAKINLLHQHIHIAETSERSITKALQDKSVLDLEDGFEYYAAIENKCDCIITEDIHDFYFAKIELLKCEAFFEKYLMKKK